tara:strand:+ start:1122 stop:1448 length:327 start_codon:yes stop_codon:yes gene_type:complete
MKIPNYWIIPSTTRAEKDLTTKINNLIKRVCESYEISDKELMSKRRLAYIVRPRQIIMYILRNDHKMTLERIATLFNKNHATIIHSVKSIENMISYDKDLKNKVNYLR